MIPAYAQLNAASTIVVGRDYGTSRFWRNGGVANRISRSSPVPVIVLPTSAPVGPAAPVSLKRIMVAVDFNVASAIGVRVTDYQPPTLRQDLASEEETVDAHASAVSTYEVTPGSRGDQAIGDVAITWWSA